jgi:hypothetical protein
MDKHAYDNDFHAWTVEQSAALRRAADLGSNLGLDFENLAEEIESMGRSDKREIDSRLKQVLLHLAKLEWSPDANPRNGWRRTIIEQRDQIGVVLRASPSLARFPCAILGDAWTTARELAAEDLGLRRPSFPAECPYTAEQVLDDAWWPTNRHGLKDPE